MKTAAPKPIGQAALKARPGATERNIISLKEANAIFHQLTGSRKSLKVLADIIHERPHLGVFDFHQACCRPRFLGVRKDRWQYFLKMRLLLCGRREIFHANGD